ncbi:MAG: hypothetical protein K2X50_00455 [Gammaproteobacteria bacterium]|nr:hypothetical protein [Gammaproteobacteria bacterium]
MQIIDEKIAYGIESFSECPPCELWRCLVSRNRQAGVSKNISAKGPLSQDILEPGYLQGAFSGLEFILQSLSSSEPTILDADFLLALHSHTTANVFEEVPIENELDTKFIPLDQNYRNITGAGFKINIDPNNPGQNATPAGINELINEFKNGYSRFVRIDGKKMELSTTEEVLTALENGHIVSIESRPLPNLTPDEIRQSVISYVNLVFEEHHRLPKETEEQKLYAIAKTIRTLEVFHPFKDANCRTMNLLRQYLLAINHLPPSVISNNDRIDGFSLEELVHEIQQGFLIYSNIKNQITENNSDYSLINNSFLSIKSCPIGKKPTLCGIVSKFILNEIEGFKKAPRKKQEKLLNYLTSVLSEQDSWSSLELNKLKRKFSVLCKPIIPSCIISSKSKKNSLSKTPVDTEIPQFSKKSY